MQKATELSTLTVPVPDHRTLRVGTLLSIIRQLAAGVVAGWALGPSFDKADYHRSTKRQIENMRMVKWSVCGTSAGKDEPLRAGVSQIRWVGSGAAGRMALMEP